MAEKEVLLCVNLSLVT